MNRLGGDSRLSIFGGLVILVVIGSVVAGLVVTGGPNQARREAADEKRSNHLDVILRRVRAFYKRKQILPATFSQAIGQGASELHDPVTGRPYEYRVIDKTTFELCATFETSSLSRYGTYFPFGADRFRRHKKGRECFEFPATPN